MKKTGLSVITEFSQNISVRADLKNIVWLFSFFSLSLSPLSFYEYEYEYYYKFLFFSRITRMYLLRLIFYKFLFATVSNHRHNTHKSPCSSNRSKFVMWRLHWYKSLTGCVLEAGCPHENVLFRDENLWSAAEIFCEKETVQDQGSGHKKN